MKITNQQEEAIIQDLLPKMLEQPGHPYPLTGTVPEAYIVVILNRLTTEGLVTLFNPSERDYVVRLTTKGVTVARHNGGYQGYLQAEQQNQIERDTREQKTAQATLDSVRANWWAVRVSLGGILVGAIFSAISLVKSNSTASDLDVANAKIKLLQQQVQALSAPAPAAARPQITPPQATQARPMQPESGGDQDKGDD